jgi:hypothetical protein
VSSDALTLAERADAVLRAAEAAAAAAAPAAPGDARLRAAADELGAHAARARTQLAALETALERLGDGSPGSRV